MRALLDKGLKLGYFDSKENVHAYIKMAQGYDGSDLINILKQNLPSGATVLELGMGPGKDLELLRKDFKVTGSDNSNIFLDLYRKKNKEADLILLDAVTLDITRKFDCIYSNKVLHHLSKDELQQSFQRQSRIINSNGILFHTFWYGDKEEFYHGLRFAYYTEKTISNVLGKTFEILELKRYKEMKKGDSFHVILKERK